MPKYRLPTVTMTTDIVIFTVRELRLEVLLIRRGNPPFAECWALSGGLLEVEEDLDVCARRELEEETGVTGLALEQFHAFGAPGRDPRGRVVTVAYLTMVRPGSVSSVRAGSDAAEAGWFDVAALPPLAFDHGEIIAEARRRLWARFAESAAAFDYLPESFTLAEVKALYQLIRGEPLSPARFRSWALARGLIATAGKRPTGPRRRVQLYRPSRRDPS